MFHYLLFNQGSHVGVSELRSLQNLVPSRILLSLFILGEGAPHNHYALLAYFCQVGSFPLAALLNILFDGNFPIRQFWFFNKLGGLELENNWHLYNHHVEGLREEEGRKLTRACGGKATLLL